MLLTLKSSVQSLCRVRPLALGAKVLLCSCCLQDASQYLLLYPLSTVVGSAALEVNLIYMEERLNFEGLPGYVTVWLFRDVTNCRCAAMPVLFTCMLQLSQQYG